jgi:outer membrane protein with beta-barrel domain
MLRRFGLLTVAAIVIAATPAAAQDERKVQLNVGGGFTGVYGSASDHIGNGGNFTLGVIFNMSPTASIQGEYGWNGMKKKNIQLPVSVNPLGDGSVPTDFFADANMQYWDANFLLHAPASRSSKAQPYGLAGLGVYYRPVSITTPAVGYTTVCDPYWYVCYPTLVQVDQVVGSRSSTDFGMNFGGGVNYKLGEHSSIYFEIRYHYIWGPSIDQASQPIAGGNTSSTKANGQFLPITVGFRF